MRMVPRLAVARGQKEISLPCPPPVTSLSSIVAATQHQSSFSLSPTNQAALGPLPVTPLARRPLWRQLTSPLQAWPWRCHTLTTTSMGVPPRACEMTSSRLSWKRRIGRAATATGHAHDGLHGDWRCGHNHNGNSDDHHGDWRRNSDAHNSDDHNSSEWCGHHHQHHQK